MADVFASTGHTFQPILQSEVLAPTAAEILAWRPPCDCDPTRLANLLIHQAELTMALVMSQPFLAGLVQRMDALILAMNPVSDAAFALNLWKTGNPWWCGACIVFMILPLVVLFFAFRSKGERIAAFEKTFHFGGPSPISFIRADVMHAAKTMLCSNVTSEEQTYFKVRTLAESTFGAMPWTFFQLYIAFKQFLHPEIQLVNPIVVAVSIVFSLNSLRSSASYFSTYASIQTGGNMAHFIDLLLKCGQGAAPPVLLEKLRTYQHVVVEEDLSALDPHGVVSICVAMKTSLVLRTVTFQDTGLKVPPAGWWPWYCCKAMCGNRNLLQKVIFKPSLGVEQVRWNFADALHLETVVDGEVTRFDRSAIWPATRLRLAIDAGDVAEARAAFQETYGEEREAARDREFRLAAKIGDWRVLAALLAEEPSWAAELPALLCDAVANNQLPCVRLLLFARAQLHAASKFHDNSSKNPASTPLHVAAMEGHCAAIQLLLGQLADPNIQLAPGEPTPLDLTTLTDQPDAAKLLLTSRADVRVGMGDGDGVNGWTHLQRCAQNNHGRVTAHLLSARADTEGRSGSVTPLIRAADNGSQEVLELLLAARANTAAKTSSGMNALDHARKRGHKEACDALLRMQA